MHKEQMLHKLQLIQTNHIANILIKAIGIIHTRLKLPITNLRTVPNPRQPPPHNKLLITANAHIIRQVEIVQMVVDVGLLVGARLDHLGQDGDLG